MRCLLPLLRSFPALGVFLAATSAAQATPFTLTDQYWGGVASDSNTQMADVIGDSQFNTHSATIERDGEFIEIAIRTNYAGISGQELAYGTEYGDVLFTFDWSPTGDGPEYVGDVFAPGDWSYAFDLINGAPGATEGDGAFYAITDKNIGMSRSDGGFRRNVAVDLVNLDPTSALGQGSWKAIVGDTLTVRFNDNGLLGNDFAMSWAMTCANDVLQGLVSLTPQMTTRPPGPNRFTAPAPASVSLFGLALAFIAMGGYRTRQLASCERA